MMTIEYQGKNPSTVRNILKTILGSVSPSIYHLEASLGNNEATIKYKSPLFLQITVEKDKCLVALLRAFPRCSWKMSTTSKDLMKILD